MDNNNEDEFVKLDKLTKREIQKICKQQNIQYSYNQNKQKLIDAILLRRKTKIEYVYTPIVNSSENYKLPHFIIRSILLLSHGHRKYGDRINLHAIEIPSELINCMTTEYPLEIEWSTLLHLSLLSKSIFQWLQNTLLSGSVNLNSSQSTAFHQQYHDSQFSLIGYQKLRSLNFEGTSSFLVRTPPMPKLNSLSAHNISTWGKSFVHQTFSMMTNLTRLKLVNSPISSDLISEISKLRLKKLDLSNLISKDDWQTVNKQLLRYLKKENNHLESLSLPKKISFKNDLLDCLKSKTNLKSLKLKLFYQTTLSTPPSPPITTPPPTEPTTTSLSNNKPLKKPSSLKPKTKPKILNIRLSYQTTPSSPSSSSTTPQPPLTTATTTTTTTTPLTTTTTLTTTSLPKNKSSSLPTKPTSNSPLKSTSLSISEQQKQPSTQITDIKEVDKDSKDDDDDDDEKDYFENYHNYCQLEKLKLDCRELKWSNLLMWKARSWFKQQIFDGVVNLTVSIWSESNLLSFLEILDHRYKNLSNISGRSLQHLTMKFYYYKPSGKLLTYLRNIDAIETVALTLKKISHIKWVYSDIQSIELNTNLVVENHDEFFQYHQKSLEETESYIPSNTLILKRISMH